MKQEVIDKIGASKKGRIAYAKSLQECLDRMRKDTYSIIHTCSIFLWFQIREKGDLLLLLKEKRQITKIEVKALYIIYEQMQDEYVALKGLSDEEKRLQELTNEIIERVQNRILNDDDTEFTFIDIAKQQIEELTQNNSEKTDLFKLKVTLEKVCGLSMPINVYQCSVAEFIGYIKFAEEQNNQNSE